MATPTRLNLSGAPADTGRVFSSAEEISAGRAAGSQLVEPPALPESLERVSAYLEQLQLRAGAALSHLDWDVPEQAALRRRLDEIAASAAELVRILARANAAVAANPQPAASHEEVKRRLRATFGNADPARAVPDVLAKAPR